MSELWASDPKGPGGTGRNLRDDVTSPSQVEAAAPCIMTPLIFRDPERCDELRTRRMGRGKLQVTGKYIRCCERCCFAALGWGGVDRSYLSALPFSHQPCSRTDCQQHN